MSLSCKSANLRKRASEKKNNQNKYKKGSGLFTMATDAPEKYPNEMDHTLAVRAVPSLQIRLPKKINK